MAANWAMLKPTVWKLVFLLLFILLSYLIPKPEHEEDHRGVLGVDRDVGFGYPIVFYGTRFQGDVAYDDFFPVAFVSELIAYYLIICNFFYLISLRSKS